MPSLPEPWASQALSSHLLQETRGVQTWEWQGPQGKRLLKVQQGYQTQFLAEFDFLSSLQHAGLPRAQGHRFQENTETYAREFLDGPPLSELFGKISFPKVVQLLAQSLRALAALHFHGFAHGDLSGGNIIANPERGAVLIDFEFLSPRHQQTGKIRGTPRCMAPELFWGQPPAIPSDLYALGCILYGLIAGHYPFEATDFDSLLQQHALKTPADPVAARPEFPRELGWLTLRLLAKDPAQRFADCNEVILQLNRSLGLEEALEPAPPSLAPQEQLRARQSYSQEHSALRFLQAKSQPSAEELKMMAELLLKTGDLEALEGLLPRLASEDRTLFLGLLLNRRGRYGEALAHFFQDLGGADPRAILGLATALYHNGKIAEALQRLRQVPLASLPTGAPMGAFNNMAGNLLLFERRLGEAREAYEKALAESRASGATALEALVLMNLANVQQSLGEWREALENYRKACELFDALGLEREKTRAELNLAGVLRFSGHLESSQTLIEAAEEKLRRFPNPQLEAYSLLLRVDLAKKRGDFPSALSLLQSAQGQPDRNASSSDRGDLWVALAETHWAAERYEDAKAALAQARDWAEQSSDSLLERRLDLLERWVEGFRGAKPNPEGLLFAAETLREQGDVEFLLDNLGRGLERARRLGWTGFSDLQQWTRRLAEKTEGALPADDRIFFRQIYRSLWEEPIMQPFSHRPPAESSGEDRLESILEWVRELSGELNLQELSEKILERMMSFADMERGFVILKEGQRLSVLHSFHMNGEEHPGPGEESLSWSLTRRALTQGEPLVTANAQSDTRLSLAGSIRDLDLRAVMVLPFRFRGETIGAVYLDSKRPSDPARPKDVAYLRGLTDILGTAVRSAALFEQSSQDLEAAQRSLQRSQEDLELRYQYQRLVGRCSATQNFLQRVDRVTEVRAPVLLYGETGVGKELIARAIHYNGPWKKGPFVAANCSAIPENLVESELFGHERGAFTGAVESRPGLFEQAHRGTLLLDEIGDMPLAVQAKLLRVLQEGEVKRIGGMVDRKVQVRVIAATHRDLKSEIQQGRFREDLFYRLSVAEISIPPLRDRRDDIPLLVDHFLQKFAEQNEAPKKQVHPKVLGALTHYPWPGNIRELENLVYNLCIFSGKEQIGPEDLRQKPELAALLEMPLPAPQEKRRRGSDPLQEALDRGEINLSEAKRRFEREEIVRILNLHQGKVGAAAEHLGIARPHLSRLLRYYRVHRPAAKSG